jgi:hypothetical protein
MCKVYIVLRTFWIHAKVSRKIATAPKRWKISQWKCVSCSIYQENPPFPFEFLQSRNGTAAIALRDNGFSIRNFVIISETSNSTFVVQCYNLTTIKLSMFRADNTNETGPIRDLYSLDWSFSEHSSLIARNTWDDDLFYQTSNFTRPGQFAWQGLVRDHFHERCFHITGIFSCKRMWYIYQIYVSHVVCRFHGWILGMSSILRHRLHRLPTEKAPFACHVCPVISDTR